MAVSLAATEYGGGAPVCILHGLFGAARNWTGIARRLGQHYRVVALDLRNHGSSSWSPTMGYAEMAEDVRAAMRARGHLRYASIGHSMGGKVAMMAALTGGSEIERLVVVDIAPIAYPVAYLPYVRAMRALDLGSLARRNDADHALASAIADPVERAFLLQNLVWKDGSPHWRLNLAAIEAALPMLSGFPAVPPDTAYRGPALFVAGEMSNYLGPESEADVHHLFPNARIAKIGRSGHWVHADQPDAFVAAVAPFLAG